MCIMSMSGWGAAEQPAPDDPRRRFATSVPRASRRGVSSLMYACQQGDVETLRDALHVQPRSAYQKDRTGKTALHYCCTSDSKKAAQAADFILMAAPDLIDGRDEDGFTPLHLAVIAGNMPLVTFLLASKADVNAVDSEQHTVVHWATVCGETEALRGVLAAGAPVSTPDVHGGYPLHYAAQMCGGEKDYQLGFQVLHALLQHPEVNVSVQDGDGRPPLLWAASAGSARAMLALIKAGAAVEASDKDGLTALHCAASRGHTDCLDTLLTLCGASVDVIDSNGCTALHYAVTLGHADATALLLAHGANANRQDRKGRSPAHCGCAKGQLETVKMLGTHGANLWLRNARGDLPLHEAAGSGRRDLVKWLLEARPSQVNARNNDGRCPLHLAALNDNADMCKILLDLAAQVNPILRTSKNIFMTPLDCAMQRGFRSTAKYLQLQGGLLANKMGGLPQKPGSGVNLQIRDDVTFWGDTSTDSEHEKNGEEKRRKRSYKRKLAYKYERRQSGSESAKSKEKREAARRSDKEKERLSEKETESAREKVTYNSKVEIVTSQPVNFQQDGSVTITKDSGKSEEEQRPKSARPKDKPVKKETTFKKKPKLDTPDPRRKETHIHQESNKSPQRNVSPQRNISPPRNITNKSPQRNIQDFNDNIREIESLAQSIEEKAKSICKEVHTIENNPDVQSLTSFEEDQHQKLVVEASVHAQPKTQVSPEISKSQDDMYKEVIESLKAELESIKAEIKVMKAATPQELEQQKNEAKLLEEREKQVVQELKDILEGRIQEIKNTVEEFKTDIKSAIKSGEVIPEAIAKSVTEALAQERTECNKSRLEIREPVTMIQLESSQSPNKVVKEESPRREAVSGQIVAESPRREVTSKDKKIVSESPRKEVAGDDEKIVGSPRSEAVNNVKKVVEDSVKIVQNVVEAKGDKSEIIQEVLEVQKHEFIQSNQNGGEIMETDQLEIGKTENVIQDMLGEKIEAEETEEAEASIDETTEADAPQTEAQVETTEGEDKQEDVEQNRFLKSEKRDHHLHIPLDKQVTQDSSIDAKSSEEEEANSSESSNSSTATKREHKSFTVLEESHSASRNNRRNGRKSSRKNRSRSEETRLKNKENLQHERLRRSKIPTASIKSEESRRAKSNLESRVPILPNLTKVKYTKSETNLVAIRDYSDNEGSDDEDALKKRKVKKRSKVRSARGTMRGEGGGSDYESSNLIDSGFEPSPRSSRIPKWKNVSERGVNMTSVTQSIQGNIRKYHLERKIFQNLLDLKRMQIRAGQHNEAMMVKRAIDSYHRSCAATVGAGRYVPKDYTFSSFEQFLYNSLRKIQKNSYPEYLKGLPESAIGNPMLCTQSTNRCMHATHAYTGIPCAAYLPKMDHHTIPKIGFGKYKSHQNFLPDINSGKKAVTLELCHGTDKQVISLPTDRLDQNKRYYVTFTVKGHPSDSSHSDEKEIAKEEASHQHSKSD